MADDRVSKPIGAGWGGVTSTGAGGRLDAWKEEALLGSAALGVVVANLLVSLHWPNEGMWAGQRMHGYLLNQLLTATGLYLAFPPVLLVQGLVLWDSRNLPSVTNLIAWSFAVVAVRLVLTRFPLVPLWRRAFYAYVVGTQLAGFAASHWSNVGN